jgi:hypothetical protein
MLIRTISGFVSLIVFAWLGYLLTLELIFADFTASPPISDVLFIVEWIFLGIVSFWIAWRPPTLKSTVVKTIFLAFYIAFVFANVAFMFAGGKCLDIRGNIYSEADILLKRDGFLSDADFVAPEDGYLCIAQVL